MQLLNLGDWRDLDARLLILVSILAISTLTYLITSARAHHAISRHQSRSNDAVDPPTAPFAIPGLAHTLPFVLRTAACISELMYVTASLSHRCTQAIRQGHREWLSEGIG